MITNSKSVGGFRGIIGRKVLFDDGKFEVTLVKYPKKLADLQGIVNGLVLQNKDDHIYQFRASEITFDAFEEIAWTRDGEYGGTYEHVEVKNLKQAIKIVVNQNALSSISEQGKESGRR